MRHPNPGLFRAVFDNTSDAVYIIDPESSNVIDANSTACTDLGMTPDEVINHSVLSINKDVIGLEQWQSIAAAIKESGNFRFVGRHKRKDETDFPVEITTSYFVYEGQEYFVSIARDISAREKDKQNLKDNAFLRTYILNEASDGLWDWNLADNSLFLSAPWFRMCGYGPDEVKTPTLNTWKDALHEDDVDRVIGILNDHLSGKSSRYEAKYRLKTRQGHYIWVHDRGMVVAHDDEGNPTRVIGMVLDITESQQLANQLLKQSQVDDLTELLNRRTGYELFENHLAISELQGSHLQVIMFDLDNFKHLNDNYGHLNGDRAILHFASTIKNKIRKTDALFRWGGEEFLLLCPGTDFEIAHDMVDRLLKELSSETFETDEGVEMSITASAGISSYPKDGYSIKELVKAADAAMFRSKELGKNRVSIQADLVN